MGFCLFNNVAIAAEAARRLGAERVLILDWDVHHGNGTQHSFEQPPGRAVHVRPTSTRFIRAPARPTRSGAGEGAGLHRQLRRCRPGRATPTTGPVFEDLFLPIAEAFRPDLVLVSAGFDPHARDPLARDAGDRAGLRGHVHRPRASWPRHTLRRPAGAGARGRLRPGRAGRTRPAPACEVLTGANESFPSGRAARPAGPGRQPRRRWPRSGRCRDGRVPARARRAAAVAAGIYPGPRVRRWPRPSSACSPWCRSLAWVSLAVQVRTADRRARACCRCGRCWRRSPPGGMPLAAELSLAAALAGAGQRRRAGGRAPGWGWRWALLALFRRACRGCASCCPRSCTSATPAPAGASWPSSGTTCCSSAACWRRFLPARSRRPRWCTCCSGWCSSSCTSSRAWPSGNPRWATGTTAAP